MPVLYFGDGYACIKKLYYNIKFLLQSLFFSHTSIVISLYQKCLVLIGFILDSTHQSVFQDLMVQNLSPTKKTKNG